MSASPLLLPGDGLFSFLLGQPPCSSAEVPICWGPVCYREMRSRALIGWGAEWPRRWAPTAAGQAVTSLACSNHPSALTTAQHPPYRGALKTLPSCHGIPVGAEERVGRTDFLSRHLHVFCLVSRMSRTFCCRLYH